jgi:hypothetical protein
MAKLTTTEYVALGGLILATYGAILSTINSIVQIIAHRKDRADVIVMVRPNMVSTDAMHKKMTIITAINKGKRPVRVEGFAARQIDTTIHLMFTDVRPRVPYQLTESQSISAYIDELYGDLKGVETYFVYDSVGREFNCHVMPWHRRLLSKYRRRFSSNE